MNHDGIRVLISDDRALVRGAFEVLVNTHVSRLLMKLGTRELAQSVIAAYESGLLDQQPFPHTPS